jgi:hypothetical protein
MFHVCAAVFFMKPATDRPSIAGLAVAAGAGNTADAELHQTLVLASGARVFSTDAGNSALIVTRKSPQAPQPPVPACPAAKKKTTTRFHLFTTSG